jgi:hypothetical protein
MFVLSDNGEGVAPHETVALYTLGFKTFSLPADTSLSGENSRVGSEILCGEDVPSSNLQFNSYFNYRFSEFGVGAKYALTRLAPSNGGIQITTKKKGFSTAAVIHWEKVRNSKNKEIIKLKLFISNDLN